VVAGNCTLITVSDVRMFPIEISIDKSFFGVLLLGLCTADLWVGDEISCSASFTGDRLMVEDTSRLPELVLDIIDEFIEDIPEVSTELAPCWLHSNREDDETSRSVTEPARELLWRMRSLDRDLDKLLR